MPLFAHRSLARMAGPVRLALGPKSKKRLELAYREGIAAVAAQWEIAVTYAFCQQGEVAPSGGARSDPEFLFEDPRAGRMVVEVTAVSDKSFHERNPVNAFSEAIHRRYAELKLFEAGAVDVTVKGRETKNGMVLGVPAETDIAMVIERPDFATFFDSVAKEPTVPHRLRTVFRDAECVITHKPGAAYSSGGFPVFNQYVDAHRNPIMNSLRKKTRQIRNAGLEIPSLLVVCNNGSGNWYGGALNRFGLNLQEIVMKHCEHNDVPSAIVFVDVEEIRGSLMQFHNVTRRPWYKLFVSSVARNPFPDHQTVRDVVERALSVLAPLRATPLNARHVFSLPQHYGGLAMTGNEIKVSLGVVQRLLSGDASMPNYVSDHEYFIAWVQQWRSGALEVIGFRVEECPDEDDDWAVFAYRTRATTA